MRKGFACALLVVLMGMLFGAAAQAKVLVKKIRLTKTFSILYTTDTLQLSVQSISPSAARQDYTWGSSDTRIARVDQDGLVTPRKPGIVTIYARAADGSKVKGVCTVRVKRDQQRRALVVGCEKGNKRYGTVRLPSILGEVQGVGHAMMKSRFADGYGISVSALLNPSKAGIKSAIAKKFAGAAERDVSYLYLTGHGIRMAGEYYVLPCTDQLISARELRAWLDQVPGKVVLVVNACYSGTVIAGKSVQPDFSQGFVSAFSRGSSKYTTITSDKYVVLCATGPLEEGWVYRDEETGRYVDTFGTPFAAGAGWDYVAREKSFLADGNGDWAITHREMYRYLREEVSRRAGALGEAQGVVAYPDGGSDFLLFAQ